MDKDIACQPFVGFFPNQHRHAVGDIDKNPFTQHHRGNAVAQLELDFLVKAE